MINVNYVHVIIKKRTIYEIINILKPNFYYFKLMYFNNMQININQKKVFGKKKYVV